MSDADSTILRVDKWLWAARFFKTRAQAAQAVTGGHVRLNEERTKPARLVKIGDSLRITRGRMEYHIVVRGLSKRRGPASDAQKLYEETEKSRDRREQLREALRIERAAAPRMVGRPEKRARRQIVRFTKKR